MIINKNAIATAKKFLLEQLTILDKIENLDNEKKAEAMVLYGKLLGIQPKTNKINMEVFYY